MMENTMAVGGIASLQFFQQSGQLNNQAVQLQSQKFSQDAQALISRSSSNALHNQQTHVSTLQSSIQRGQGLDLYV